MSLVIIILVSVVVGFGGGWGVKGWKDGAEVALAVSAKEKVESRNAILEAANASCATDIEGVKKGVAVVVKATEDRERAASAAMAQAETLVEKHKVAAVKIKELPPVSQEPEAQCKAIIGEQIEYVAGRRSGHE